MCLLRDPVRPFPSLVFRTLDREAHLLRKLAGNETPDGVIPPAGGPGDLRERCAALTAQQFDHDLLLAALAWLLLLGLGGGFGGFLAGGFRFLLRGGLGILFGGLLAGELGVLLGGGLAGLLLGALLRGGLVRRAGRALFRNGGGFGAGGFVRHGLVCVPFWRLMSATAITLTRWIFR